MSTVDVQAWNGRLVDMHTPNVLTHVYLRSTVDPPQAERRKPLHHPDPWVVHPTGKIGKRVNYSDFILLIMVEFPLRTDNLGKGRD